MSKLNVYNIAFLKYVILFTVIVFLYITYSATQTYASLSSLVAQRVTDTPVPSPTVVLTAPTNLQTICPIPGKITYTWAPVNGAARYRIANNPIAQGSAVALTNSFQKDIIPGSTINWYVAAERSNGEIGPESHATGSCPAVPPPTNITTQCDLSDKTTYTASVSWTPGSGILGSGGQLKNVTTNSIFPSFGQTGLSSTFVNTAANHIISGYLFNYITIGSTSYYSTHVAIPTFSCPKQVSLTAPTGLSASCPSPGNKVTYTWNPVAGATSYIFANNPTSGGGTYVTSSTLITEGVPGRTMSWYVAAYNNTVKGPESSSTVTCGPVPAPTALDISCSGSTATLTWSSMKNLSGSGGQFKDLMTGKSSQWGQTASNSINFDVPNNNDISGYMFNYVSMSNGINYYSNNVSIPTFTCPLKITPTPTSVPNDTTCICTNNVCDISCSFTKYSSSDISNVNYSNPIGCSLSSVPFSSTLTQTNKNQWCQRNLRTKGDATGDGKIDDLDYFYYVQAVSGGTMPIDSSKSRNVNPDFNGNGSVGTDDRIIVIHSLQSGL